MRGGSRRRLLLLAVVVLVGATVAASLAVPRDTAPAEPTEDARLVGVGSHEAQLWPYTSRQHDFETRTLPINLVVKADLSTTRRVLAADEGRSWTTDDPEGEAVVVTGSGVNWTETTGADRYTYYETDDGGRWMDESAQIHDGTYLGARYHLRLYEVTAGGESYTAIQAHTEHWDWFRLRHTVGSTAHARYAVEHEFYGTGTIADVSRERFGNGGALDADGWVTVFDLIDFTVQDGTTLSGLLLLVTIGARGRAWLDSAREAVATVRRSRVSPVHVTLFGSLLVAPLAVRWTAVSLERLLTDVSPKLVAAPLYLVLAVGLPLAAGVLGRRLAADDAFATASVALGLGLLLDYAWLGVTSLPVGVIVHRLVLLLGIGLIAAGGIRWAATPLQRHRYRLAGVVVWVGALVWPLAGF